MLEGLADVERDQWLIFDDEDRTPRKTRHDAEPQAPIIFSVAAVIGVVGTPKLWIFYGTGPHSSSTVLAPGRRKSPPAAVVEFSAEASRKAEDDRCRRRGMNAWAQKNLEEKGALTKRDRSRFGGRDIRI